MAISSFFSGMGDVIFANMNISLFGDTIPGEYVFIHREHGTANFSTKRYAGSTDNRLVIRRSSTKIRRGSFRNFIEFHGVCRQISGIDIEQTRGTQAGLYFEPNNEDSVYHRQIGAPLPHRFQDLFMKNLLTDRLSLSEAGSTISFGIVVRNFDSNFEGVGFRFCQVELAPSGVGDRQTLIGIQIPHEDDCENVPSNSLLSQLLDTHLIQVLQDPKSLARKRLIALRNYTLSSKDSDGDESLFDVESDERDDWKAVRLNPSTEDSIGLMQNSLFAAGEFEKWLSCFETSTAILRALTKVTLWLQNQKNSAKGRLHMLMDAEKYVLDVQKVWEGNYNTKAAICRSDKHQFDEIIAGDESTIGLREDGFSAQLMEHWLVHFSSEGQEINKIVARLAAYLRQELRRSTGRLQAIKEAFEYAEKRREDWKAQIDRRQISKPVIDNHRTDSASSGGLKSAVPRYGRGCQQAGFKESLGRSRSKEIHGVDGTGGEREEEDVKMTGEGGQEPEADKPEDSDDSDGGGVALNRDVVKNLMQMIGAAPNQVSRTLASQCTQTMRDAQGDRNVDYKQHD